MADLLLITFDDWKLCVDYRREIADMNFFPIDHRSADRRLAIVRCVLECDQESSKRGNAMNIVALQTKDLRVGCCAQASSARCQRMQHRRKIARRARDHAKNVASRSLLLTAFFELVLEEVVKKIREIFQFDAARIFIFDEARQTLNAMASFGLDGRAAAPF